MYSEGNYEINTDYQRLTDIVKSRISEKKKSDSSFSTEKLSNIDELVSHDVLDEFSHDTIVRVAADQGMIYSICTGYTLSTKEDGSRVLAHESPRYRVNGKFAEVKKDIADYLRVNHLHQESSTMCPECANHFRKEWRDKRESKYAN